MALKRIWKPSPNYSSRGGSSVRLVTVHTSEGAQTNGSLYNYISQASAQVSYSISVDNQSPGTCYEYVSRANKPWSQANYNPVAVTGCFCTASGASSGWSRDYWLKNQDSAIRNMAQWVAEECAFFNIPIVALSDSQAQGNGRGVCQHRNLGANGSNHSDCGSNFPMDYLIDLAKGGSAPVPETGDDVSASSVIFDGKLHSVCVWNDGRLNYKFENDAWYAIDPNASNKVKSGAGITVNHNSGLLVVTYTNSNSKVCTWQKLASAPKSAWAWVDRGGNAK